MWDFVEGTEGFTWNYGQIEETSLGCKGISGEQEGAITEEAEAGYPDVTEFHLYQQHSLLRPAPNISLPACWFFPRCG